MFTVPVADRDAFKGCVRSARSNRELAKLAIEVFPSMLAVIFEGTSIPT